MSILSKRLTSYIIQYISQPGWINHRLVSLFALEKTASQLNLTKYAYISLFDVNLTNNLIENVKNESKIEKKNESSTPQLSPKKEKIILNKNGEEVTKIDSLILSDPDSMLEKALTKMITQHTAPILQKAEKNLLEKEIVSTFIFLI